MICNVDKVGSSEMRKSFCAFSTVVEKIAKIIVNIIFGFL